MGYVTQTITKFKGMNQSRSGVSLDPAWALSCVNVIPNTEGGNLEKLRLPVALSAVPLPGITDGPSQFFMFSNALTEEKQVLAFFGSEVYAFTLDTFASAFVHSNTDYIGTTPLSGVVSNNYLFFGNGTSQPLKWSGSVLSLWGIIQAPIPTLGVPFGPGITLATGRMYRVSYKSTVTQHVGTASDPSASSGPLANQAQPITIAGPVPADTQVDAVRVYSTLDGGSDFFFNAEVPGPFPITFNDTTSDATLDQSERAPLINNKPPKAKYLVKWGARIFGFNLTTDEINPQGIWYTGYNRILVGRPEETVPPGNRLLLATGADEISGGGVIAAGIIAFDKSNKMFMFRGQPEDITTNAPVEFTLYLQQLPWDIGCSGHFTIQSSAYGLIWRTPDKQVRLFNGSDQPSVISAGVEPIMKSITNGTETNERAVLWSYNERNWYVLAIAINGSTNLNQLLIFDLEPSPEDNVGIFALAIGAFSSLGVIEMVSGEQKLVIGQAGLLKELTVQSKCINGVTQNPDATTGVLGALWRSGYFGDDQPQLMKFMRFSRISADTDGFSVKRYLVDDDVSTMAQPDIIDVTPLDTAKFETNMDTRRMSIELQFPNADKDCSVQLMTNSYTPGAER